MPLDRISLTSGYDLANSRGQGPTELLPVEQVAPGAKSASKENEKGFGRAVVIELSVSAKDFLARLDGKIQRQTDIRLENLTEEERQDVKTAYEELDRIFAGRYRKRLNATERGRVASLTQSINLARGFELRDLSEAEAREVDNLERQIDALLEDPDRVLTPSQEGQLARAMGRIEEIYQTRHISFFPSGSERGLVEEIERELDAIYEVTPEHEPGLEDIEEATMIYEKLDHLFLTTLRRLQEGDG